jgi:rhodanese-related sulfurtransferase
MDITVDELRALGESGATVLNVGSHQGGREIRGAVRYRPSDLLEAAHLALPLAADRPVVLYDADGAAERTREIAARLQRDGFPDVRVLQGGFAAWESAGAPLQEASLEQTVPPSRASEAGELDRRW